MDLTLGGDYYANYIFKMMRKTVRNVDMMSRILSTGFFQTYKDFTEVMSAVDNLKSHIISEKLHSIFKGNCVFFVVGDGKDPQTGYVLANIFICCDIFSIDPRLRCNKKQDNIIMNNQILCKELIENCSFYLNKNVENVCIVCVHNHGPIQKLHDDFISQNKRVITISIPCCTTDTNLKHPPHAQFKDLHITSKKNEIYIWDSKYYNQ